MKRRTQLLQNLKNLFLGGPEAIFSLRILQRILATRDTFCTVQAWGLLQVLLGANMSSGMIFGTF